jgi:hypothetical protein
MPFPPTHRSTRCISFRDSDSRRLSNPELGLAHFACRPGETAQLCHRNSNRRAACGLTPYKRRSRQTTPARRSRRNSYSSDNAYNDDLHKRDERWRRALLQRRTASPKHSLRTGHSSDAIAENVSAATLPTISQATRETA